MAGVRVFSTGHLDPNVPDWIFSPNEDIERTLITGLAWPPLRSLLESPIGAGIDVTDLGRSVAIGLADRYRSEIKSRETKFRHVSGFDVQVSRDGELSIRDQGTQRPIDTYFHAFNDKHLLFESLNEAVRLVGGEDLDIPIVLLNASGWMAVDRLNSGKLGINQIVIVTD
jgi:hypothetical protein